MDIGVDCPDALDSLYRLAAIAVTTPRLTATGLLLAGVCQRGLA